MWIFWLHFERLKVLFFFQSPDINKKAVPGIETAFLKG